MAGYNYNAGMSNNAVNAYETGVKPLSKITASDLRDAGWKGTVKLAKALAASGIWTASEWHHSGGTWYNKVDFFDASDLVSAWSDLTADEKKKEIDKATGASVKIEEQRVEGSFAMFGGSRRHPRHIGDKKFTGTLIGNWIHIDGGGKKKVDGNAITFAKI